MLQLSVTREIENALTRENAAGELTLHIAQAVAGNRDLREAMQVGCEIETVVMNDRVIVRTRYPVSILKTPDGKVVDVIQKKSLRL